MKSPVSSLVSLPFPAADPKYARGGEAMELIHYAEIARKITPQAMKNGPICAALSEPAIGYLLRNGQLYRATPGDLVFEYGTPGDSFFIVCQGILDFYKVHNDMCRHIREIGFGDEIGFLSMIALRNRTGDAVARQRAIVLKVSAELFSDLHQSYSFDFGIMTLNLARDMARALHQVSKDLVDAACAHPESMHSVATNNPDPCSRALNLSAKVVSF